MINIELFYKPDYREYDAEEDELQAKQIAIHAKGEKPETLLRLNRPNEKDIHKNYRLDRWQPVTKTYWSKMMTVIHKIQFSEDFKVTYKENPPLINAYPFHNYLEIGYPVFGSFENWFWSVGFNSFINDANGVFYCLPNYKKTISDRELETPYVRFVPCEKILAFVRDEHFVWNSEEKSAILDREGGKISYIGRVFYYLDRYFVTRYEQVGILSQNKYVISEGYPIAHNSGGYMPAFKSGGNIREYEEDENEIHYDSFLVDTVAFFNEAVMYYSDHNANMALHIHPDRWEIASSPCPPCKGKGNIVDEKKKTTTICSNCNGAGNIAIKTPFNVMQINPSVRTGLNDATSIPTPPAGYITRPQENIDFVYNQFMEAIKQALSAVNMEFVMNVPVEQSGVAKVYDRQELNTFLLKIARHIVYNIWRPSYFFIASQRYSIIFGDKSNDIIMSMLPTVSIPIQFDVLTAELKAQRVGYAIEKGMPAPITSKLSIEYAESEFGPDDKDTVKLKLVNSLDPLPFITAEDKMVMLSNDGCTKTDYIASNYIYQFVNRALYEYPEFANFDLKKQSDIIMKYAKEKEKQTTSLLLPTIVDPLNPDAPPSDIEAEAKAKLKGSVGGVQGILEIQKSVSEGITDYNAAIVLLYEIYGFDEITARKMLGTPIKKPLTENVNTNK